MKCSINELFRKDVIDIESGAKIGTVYDVEIDTDSGQLCAVSIDYDNKQFTLKKNIINILWRDIVVIGNETILVKSIIYPTNEKNNKKNIFDLFVK